MPLTEKQRNLVVIAYYIFMLDVLVTIANISLGIGIESNPLFNWITELPLMFSVMLISNIAVTVFLIQYFNHLNQKTELRKHYPERAFTSVILLCLLVRLYAGPIAGLMNLCGVPPW